MTRCPETCEGGIGANAGHGLVLFSPLIVVQLLFSSLIVVLLFSEQQNNRSIELTFGSSRGIFKNILSLALLRSPLRKHDSVGV